MKHIKILGITGGVGAGKSTILTYLSDRYHARVIELDKAAHLMMKPGQKCYERILTAFGREILDENGCISRPMLYQKAFAEEKRVRELNGIVHPAVKEYVKEEIELEQKAQKVPFVVLEAALLLDDHYEEICDEIWYIHVNHEKRTERLRVSRGYTNEKTEEILKNQKSEKEFREKCQFVVDNSSDILENTYEQIDRGLKEHGFL